MGLLLLFAITLGTAVLPVAGAEAFLVGFMVMHGEAVPWWVAGPVAAAGQLLGKTVHLLLAGRFATVPAVHRRLAPTVARCRARPRSAAGVVLLSSMVGLPPFTAMVPAMAMSGVDLRRLLPVAALGRTARFTALAALPTLVDLLW